MPIHGLLMVEVDTGTVSRGSMETQEVVLQAVLQEVRQVAIQGVRHDRQDRQELWGLQETLGLETVGVLQTGRQED